MKRKLLIIPAAMTLALSSCGDKAPISEDKMTDLLTDYYLLEGALRHESINKPGLDYNRYYADLLREHGITAAEFDSAAAYYGARPVQYKVIYKEVTKRLRKKADDLAKEL